MVLSSERRHVLVPHTYPPACPGEKAGTYARMDSKGGRRDSAETRRQSDGGMARTQNTQGAVPVPPNNKHSVPIATHSSGWLHLQEILRGADVCLGNLRLVERKMEQECVRHQSEPTQESIAKIRLLLDKATCSSRHMDHLLVDGSMLVNELGENEREEGQLALKERTAAYTRMGRAYPLAERMVREWTMAGNTMSQSLPLSETDSWENIASTESTSQLQTAINGKNSVSQEDALRIQHEAEAQNKGLRRLAGDVSELAQTFMQLKDYVMEQGQHLETIEQNVEAAAANVEGGTQELNTAARYHLATYPLMGALAGGILFGPVGMLAAAKVAGGTAIATVAAAMDARGGGGGGWAG
eukprot:comp20521_c2_seq1/m.26284 comp20521_c2_seq1/g.26284  ORF comp20521_c2_seq1/g.26284 comp20521_c2_seq1/m.26284 type:complete len:356 (-) comp20521_c2_seq1:26-1093(-)